MMVLMLMIGVDADDGVDDDELEHDRWWPMMDLNILGHENG